MQEVPNQFTEPCVDDESLGGRCGVHGGSELMACNCSLVASAQNFEIIRVRLPNREFENVVKICKCLVMMVLAATMSGMARS